ncbi:TadE/TadG family type IV pilus assembly protein [Ferrimonas sp. YFM]|uniref:TadE/TadG family type IV pilus assembly protein n=1 Tax=Ferrimonas sp. YFM TaxID=3028878 RepID=UPI002573D3AA|nr:TadE/TadG family type IV pilus assembly protein [Ferrimonas sp. YFM]BDY04202.1 hypothetical protein F0521_12430 [Ferrimonas sp. YFM]
MKRLSPKIQRGVAAIYLAFLLAPMFSMVFLAVEGTRYIQKKNRLADATEAASMAVSMANRNVPGPGGETPAEFRKRLATAYINAYMRHTVEIDDLQILKTEGEELIGGEAAEYIQYQVSATTKHNSWFGNTGNIIPSFQSQEKVANRAMAKSYPIKRERNIDLVFVADFSGSMNRSWNSYKSKIQVLKEEINAITADLLSDQAKADGFDHRIGFVPFNMRTIEQINGDYRCVSQLDYKNANNTGVEVGHESIDWRAWSSHSYRDIRYCAEGYSYSDYCHNRPRSEARSMLKVFEAARQETGVDNPYYLDPYSFIAFQGTVNKLFDDKRRFAKRHPSQYHTPYGWGLCETEFKTLPLAKTPPSINGMRSNGYTAVYQGLLRGAQILADGIPGSGANETVVEEYKRRAKMIIILSDGSEQPFQSTFGKLVDKGLCTAIREKFKGGEVPLYIGVLGIKYSATSQQAFERCANEVIDVNNSGDLKRKIEELIAKGARTDGISRLYYRHSG